MAATEFLRFIIASIVTHTDEIQIIEKHDELGTLLSLKVDPTDMGSLIGRGGKTIDSIRTVIRVFGSKTGERINLRIIDENRV
jgi:uncharacterized protein